MTEPHATTFDKYRTVRDELINALGNVDDAAVKAIVPSCPEWTVKDVVSHLSGLNAELLADVPGSLGSDEATTRQVKGRSSASLGEVVDEWVSLTDAIEERFTANGDIAAALLADLVVHIYDLAEVLGQPTIEAAKATPASAHRYVGRLQTRLFDQMGIALTVKLDDGTVWTPNSDATKSVTLRTTPFNFLRGITGRLHRSEVESFDWSTDPGDILDHAWNQYGPFRT